MQRLRDYATLTKPEVTFLVVIATAIGYYLASQGPLDYVRFLGTCVGTGLVSAGTAALNMYWEREADARMRRTAARPLPGGRIGPNAALAFGIALAVIGGAYLFVFVGALAAALALATLLTYLLLYTPLKSRTHWCTLIGAFPGAAPPLIGWAAARGELAPEAWILYAVLFLWQFPHFLAIAWMYRQDYARAGMRMLPPKDDSGRLTFAEIVAFLVVLIPVSILPAVLGFAGPIYVAGAALLGAAFLASGVWAAADRTAARARVVLHVSVAYLPLLYALLALDHRA
jgi:protoheme IX farnesyltransferase